MFRFVIEYRFIIPDQPWLFYPFFGTVAGVEELDISKFYILGINVGANGVNRFVKGEQRSILSFIQGNV